MKRLILIIPVIFLSLVAGAQQARESFGKNRIQYKNFDWRFFSSDNFDVYFYERNDKIARKTIDFLEEEFDRITDILGYSPYSKTKVFLYASISDLQQSNIGVGDTRYTIGGQTNFVKTHVEIAHPGTLDGFRDELLLRVTSLLVNDMMFGGSLTDMFQNAYLLNLPQWFIDGVSYYIAEGWSIEMDDHIREMIVNGRIKKLSKYTGEQARFVGQAIWNYIAETYGKSNISNILNLTRIIRNEEKSIANTLGLPFRQFNMEWKSFYTGMASNVMDGYLPPPDDDRLHLGGNKGTHFNHVRISPSSTNLLYTVNKEGRYGVFVRDLISGKERRIMTGGYRVINQEVDYNLPLVNWIDDNTVGIIDVRIGKYVLWVYDLQTNTRIPTVLERFNQVNSVDFSTNGRLAIMSADVDGQNDLYLMSVRRNRFKRLTNDIYDDNDPVFIPDSNVILFSSNRTNDTLDVAGDQIKDVEGNFNLFFYDLDTTTNILGRATNTISQDYRPSARNADEIYYLSDQKGIVNLFRYSLNDKVYQQITNYALSIHDYDINFDQNIFSYITLRKQREQVYVNTGFDYNRNNFTNATKRQQVEQAKIIAERRRQRALEEARSQEPITIDYVTEIEEEPEVEEADTAVISTDDFIDTDNYVFDTEVENTKEPTLDSDSFLAQYRRLRSSSKTLGPFPYETRFSADNLITSWLIDPLKGFGILMETQMNDLLENHKFYGGIMATTDLKSGEIFMEYDYLKNLIDYNFRYDREVVFWTTPEQDVTNRYTLNSIAVGAALPLSVKTRIRIQPFLTITRKEEVSSVNIVSNIPPRFPPGTSEKYGGIKTELIFDNSVVTGMNLIEGTRGKLSFKHFSGLENQDASFSNISLDFRNYQKIHREIVFASRIFYGRFFGKSPQKYLLGGMDNWLSGNKDNLTGVGNPLAGGGGENENLLFAEYVNSLRGYNYATFFGTNAVLFNAELRFPIIRYFHRGPIPSNFFRNLQFIGFYDVGSAWSNESPFGKDTEITTEIIKQGAFQAELRNFTSPWLMSWGAGMRTVLLGYYMKFDLAWPYENYEVQNPRLHVTLGFDF